MREIALGNTGLRVSELGFGGIPILRLETSAAVAVLRRAFDRGITFYDTANAYRDSEEKIGLAFEGVRDKVVLATKTTRRDGKGALEHLEKSLRRLRTDFVDLYQLHQVAQEKDWDALTAPGGALETLQWAREKGQLRHLGVSSHNLAMAIRLVRTGLFSTIQFPFNFLEDEAKRELHPLARSLGLGILGMKPFAGGVIDDAAIAFKFLRQHPDVLPIPGFDSVEQVDEIAAFYDRGHRVESADLERMEAYRLELGKEFCRRCEYCQPCEQGVMITYALSYEVMATRMSAPIAGEICKAAMESAAKCIDCRQCVERCPYELPIPELLKAYYDRYERDRTLSFAS
jgi:uncharacterized protein